MKSVLSCAFALFMLMNGALVHADSTWVSGTIAGQTWTVPNSPYCVNGNLNVMYLTIQPGVQVHFFGNYDFRVTGTLIAVGTKEDSIIFTKAASNVPRWAGLWLDNIPAGTEIAYCRIDSANHGLTTTNAASPIVRNTTIRNNYIHGQTSTSTTGGGVQVTGSLTLTECRIEGNTSHANYLMSSIIALGGGIYISPNGNLTLNQCVVRNNRCIAQPGTGGYSAGAYGGGISLYSNGQLVLNNTLIDSNSTAVLAGNSRFTQGGGIYQNGGTATLNNCIISNNITTGGSNEGSGIFKTSSSSSLVLNNSTVAYNNNDGIKNTAGTLQITNSILYLNLPTQISGSATVSCSDVQGGWPGITNINVYPEFFGPDSLHIRSYSPCVDAGNPSDSLNDPVNPSAPANAVWPAWGLARNDMGAHGGPQADVWWQGAEIATSPIALNFGSCPVGDSLELTLTISNLGEVNLLLFNILTTSPCFTTNFNPAAYILPPGDSLPVIVTFCPQNTINYQDSLIISSSMGTIIVTMSGQGIPLPSISVTMTPLNPPINIPANGGSFQFNATVQRTQAPQAAFYAWARNRYPNGTYSGNLLGPVNINPPIGVSVTRQRTQVIDAAWPSGVNYYIGYANTSVAYPAIDADSFLWTKLTTTDGGPTVWEVTNYGEEFPYQEATGSQPSAFSLIGAYPNPFNFSTTISYQLSAFSHVSLKVYDSAGRLVATLIDGGREAGTHQATLDGSNWASGIYLVKLKTGSNKAVQKIVLLK
jgi:hypothetical protein